MRSPSLKPRDRHIYPPSPEQRGAPESLRSKRLYGSRMSDDLDAELFNSLSERLRIGHRRVATFEGDEEQKARAVRRLIAITDASKHDLRRAYERLDVFLADLDAGRVAAADD